MVQRYPLRKPLECENPARTRTPDAPQVPVQFDSSSPQQPSSQVSAADEAFIAPDSAPDGPPEIQTERLVARHVLCSAPYTQLDVSRRLEWRSRLFVKTATDGDWLIHAEDDGGLRLRLPKPTYSSGDIQVAYNRLRLSGCYHVLFEAKRRFTRFVDGRPIISDAWLGLMAAEASAGRLA